LQIDDYELRGFLWIAAGDQAGKKLVRPVGPSDVERDWRAVLFDDELKPEEAATLPFGVDDARDGLEKAGSRHKRQPVAVVEGLAVSGLCEETWKEAVTSRP